MGCVFPGLPSATLGWNWRTLSALFISDEFSQEWMSILLFVQSLATVELLSANMASNLWRIRKKLSTVIKQSFASLLSVAWFTLRSSISVFWRVWRRLSSSHG